MIARTVFFAAITALAVLVITVQLDRQTYDMPMLSGAVPATVRSQAQQRLVEAAIASRDGPAALAQARRLLSRRPVPARSLVLFAQASALAGEGPSAIAALEVAATRGWREPVVQLAVARAALDGGNHEVAADRLAALLAVGLRDAQVDALLARLIAQPAGRAALAQRMAATRYWQNGLPRLLAQVAAPADVADLYRLAWEAGAQPDCTALEDVAEAYRAGGETGAAEQLWPAGCSRR